MTARTIKEIVHDKYKDQDWERDINSYARWKEMLPRHGLIAQQQIDRIKARWPAHLHHHFED